MPGLSLRPHFSFRELKDAIVLWDCACAVDSWEPPGTSLQKSEASWHCFELAVEVHVLTRCEQ